MKNSIVSVIDLEKDFRIPSERSSSIKQAALNFYKSKYETFKVLDGVSFEVKRGEFFGILGRNGSGKSTLLKILANIYTPTKGVVKIDGELTPFIELGIGFNSELSGRDNVYLNGAILGLTHKEVDQKYNEIVGFAELEKFMDQKLKNYSSGMLVRLAFAIAIQAHNEILLIDEVLAVGDANFQQKCLDVFRNLKQSGKTVIFVTHDMNAVEEFCDRSMLIDDGKIVMIGNSHSVASKYRRLNYSQFGDNPLTTTNKRWGDGKSTIEGVSSSIASAENGVITTELIVAVDVIYNVSIANPIVGIQVKDGTGTVVFGSNTRIFIKGEHTEKAKTRKQYIWNIPNIFKTGKYSITAAVHDYGGKVYDWWDDSSSVFIEKDIESSAVTDVEHNFMVKGR